MKAVLQDELEKRWGEMFAALAAGDDVAPSARLRAEGMMEAVVLSGIASTDALVAAMNVSYESVNGKGIEEDFGVDWQVFFPFPQIPAMAKRAPVYPSTKD
ncbi:MAG: hypothetical protein ACI9JM_001767 [Halioglobus sp.]|jgi:hypothetical protein